jgi:hypothetical protein
MNISREPASKNPSELGSDCFINSIYASALHPKLLIKIQTNNNSRMRPKIPNEQARSRASLEKRMEQMNKRENP